VRPLPIPLPLRKQSAAAPLAGRERPRRFAFTLLFVSLISVGMGQSLMFAILPPIARQLGLSEVQVGAIFAVSALLWVIASPFWGARSDAWGRRPVILLGLCGFALSMASFAACVQAGLSGWLGLIPAYVLMVVSRAVFGLFGSATVPAAQAYVAERTGLYERPAEIALLGAAFGLGVTLGPGLVAALLGMGLVAPFYAVALLGAASALLVGLRLPEQLPRQTQVQPRSRMRLRDPRVLPFLLVGIALAIGQASAMQTAGFYVIDVLGYSIQRGARMVGIALMGAAAAGLFSQLVIIRLLRPSPRSLMASGALCGMGAFAGLVFGGSFSSLFSAMVLLGFSFGLVRPGAVAGASMTVGADEQGAVAGLMNTTGAIGVVFAPFVAMPLYQWIPQAPYVLSLALAAVTLLYVWLNPHFHTGAKGSEGPG
jgi:MFS family permease